MKKLAFFILLSLVTLGVSCTIKSEVECECGYWYVELVW